MNQALGDRSYSQEEVCTVSNQFRPVAAGWWIRRRLAPTQTIINKKKKSTAGRLDRQAQTCLNTHKFKHITPYRSIACDFMKKMDMKAAFGVMCHPSSHTCLDTPQFYSLSCVAPHMIYKYSAHSSPSSYLLLSSVLFWIHCPCLGTRWNKDGPWSHTQCPFWVQRGWRCAQMGPWLPGSARGLARADLMSACTKLCNPGWTGTGDPPEEVNEDKIIFLLG